MPRLLLMGGFVALIMTRVGTAAPPPALYSPKNLVAWCIVPFDSQKRTPEQRIEMLKKLGFKKYAYDWRAEHLPTFDEEVGFLQKAGIELTAVWFPANLGEDAKKLLAVIEKHKVTPQLWVMFADPPGSDTATKVAAAARALEPIAAAAEKLGCQVGLYNHGGWPGEPENQIAVITALKRKNVGIVYNLHHGHDQLERFPELLKKMQPYLLAINLNGMVKDGEKLGKKILPLGAGDLELELLKQIRASNYRGPIGILGHTQDDAAERLADNLDGLAWLVAKLDGKVLPRPIYRTIK